MSQYQPHPPQPQHQQYPSPYSVPYQYPAGYQYPIDQYLAPARKASIVMFLLGSLGMVCGLCIGVVVAVVPMGEVLASSGLQLPVHESGTGASLERIVRITYIIMSGSAFIGSLAMIVLGVFVRLGSLGAIIASLALVGLCILVLGINLVTALVQISQGAAVTGAAMGLAILLIVLGAFVTLFMLLIQATRASSQVRAMQAQYQAQYWQYQKQQQMYGGYPQQAQPPQAPQQGPGEENSSGPAT